MAPWVSFSDRNSASLRDDSTSYMAVIMLNNHCILLCSKQTHQEKATKMLGRLVIVKFGLLDGGTRQCRQTYLSEKETDRLAIGPNF